MCTGLRSCLTRCRVPCGVQDMGLREDVQEKSKKEGALSKSESKTEMLDELRGAPPSPCLCSSVFLAYAAHTQLSRRLPLGMRGSESTAGETEAEGRGRWRRLSRDAR